MDCVNEFPSSCVQRLLELAKEGDLMSMEALKHLLVVAAWAVGKLDGPDDGVIMADDYLPMCDELCEALSGGRPVGVPEPVGMPGWMLSLLLSQIIRILSDTEEAEELFEKVIDWVRKHVEK